MKSIKQSKVFHFDMDGFRETNPKLVRIELYPEYTKVDFGYIANDLYYRGGWIRMNSGSFIEIVETGERFDFQLAENIPIAPEYHYFESQKDWKYYSLYFSPIPQKDCTLNIIEAEQGDFNDFNCYGVELKMAEGIVLVD